MSKAGEIPGTVLRDMPWLIYGPTGVTGRLVVEEALARGQRPVLAGRSDSVREVGREYGLEAVVIPLEQRDELEALLLRVSRVLHVAGPFVKTAEPMLAACLATATPYIDVNGEVDSLAALLERDHAARECRIALIGGAGFGVAAGECLALHVARQLPDAQWLRIGVAADNRGLSRGALLSTLDVVRRGGAFIAGGRLLRANLGHERFRAPLGGTMRSFAAAPMAEALAAHHSTGIAHVVAGQPLSRFVTWFAPLLHWLAGRAFLRWAAMKLGATHLPATVVGKRSWAFAEARTATKRKAAVLEMGEGYAFAAQAMVRAAERIRELPAGAHTPASAFGPDFVLELSGVVRRDLVETASATGVSSGRASALEDPGVERS